MNKATETAILAAGCFWGVQAYFDQVPGVIKTVVGYEGGVLPHPTYEDVAYHHDSHAAEAVKIDFDPTKISYHDLLRHFFRMHDPTQANGQGPDVGENYRSAIFYFNDQQKRVAAEVKNQVQPKFKNPIITEISKAPEFHVAEEYHQKYFEKTGLGACHVPYSPL